MDVLRYFLYRLNISIIILLVPYFIFVGGYHYRCCLVFDKVNIIIMSIKYSLTSPPICFAHWLHFMVTINNRYNHRI